MPDEIEAKFQVTDFTAVRKALASAGGEYLGTFFHDDTYFDTPAGGLRRGDFGMRLRSVRCLKGGKRRQDTRPLLTIKGPRKGRAKVKVRKEVQSHVDDAAVARELLNVVGLVPAMIIQKRRRSYRLGRCRVELDELPLIGRFVEIEGPDEWAINAARRKLDLKGAPIATPYVEMLCEYCRRNGLPPDKIVF